MLHLPAFGQRLCQCAVSTQENTEETYIGVLTQASHKEVNRDEHRSGRKSCELLLSPVRRMRERRLTVKDEACVYCLENALDEIRLALCRNDLSSVRSNRLFSID